MQVDDFFFYGLLLFGFCLIFYNIKYLLYTLCGWSSSPQQFHDKIILLTGAGSGIGAGLAKTLAHEGSILILFDINEKALNEIAKCCREKTTVYTFLCDVSDYEYVLFYSIKFT